MKNKKEIIIAVVVVVVVIILVGLFIYKSDQSEVTPNNEEVSKEIDFNLEDSYLYKAGENGEQSFRNAAVKVDEFNVGDFLAVAGYYSSNSEGFVKMHILDDDENIIEQDVISFTVNEGEEKNFDACCSQVPSTPGNYYISLDLDDNETDFLLPFEVIQE